MPDAGKLVRLALALAPLLVLSPMAAADQRADVLARRFQETALPLLKTHCLDCHSGDKAEAKLDLSKFDSPQALAANPRVWQLIRRRLEAAEMPPEEAETKLSPESRGQLVAWMRDAQHYEAERNAGDPGVVLARRLSNAEFDYSIRDLTGVDIRPTREFPVDPANEAGFDNSGESLAMSPALLQKYLVAARQVADHIVLKPRGFVFAPHPAVTETDRDKYCVQRIVAFYERHRGNYADYFLAAWIYHHRERLGRAGDELSAFAAGADLSAKYLQTIWSVLNDPLPEIGPLAEVRGAWRKLLGETDEQPARAGCAKLRELVIERRKELAVEIPQLKVQGISPGSQPLVLWRNRQSAASHTKYSGNAQGDERAALERFCRDFPRTFVVTDRGPYFDPKQAGQGRLLTAGFHLMQGYFRDDGPLYELVLSESEQRELDALWQELDFITLVPMRQYADFIFFERAEPPRFMREETFDFARSEDKDANSPEKMAKLKELHLAKAKRSGASDEALAAIDDYYAGMSERIRRVEHDRLAAEPSHLADLLKFAERAWRRPLTNAERDDHLGFYQSLRERGELSHEDALRDTLASVLLSPNFCYRCDLAAEGVGPQPLADHALASRLSYFLWSSLPDQELLAHAAAGDLREPEVLLGQTRRMLKDEKIRGLAVEFGGNWLDFRRFEEHNAVDRGRFPQFTPELRQAMFEEPVRFLVDKLQNNRPVRDLLQADHTYVNPILARHYGIPLPGGESDDWVRVENADEFGRGGLLPMAVFQTKNSPGLRTSPVKRGYWIVRRLLGEHIPPPPPTVPELPKDEAQLGELTLPQVLARHRADKACSGCHQKFDSFGLAFEGYGPIGERRTLDLGGKPVQTIAEFPGGSQGEGLAGLQRYLHEHRDDEFLDNFCRKLLAYALGRSLLLSDEPLIAGMKTRLAADNNKIQNAIEAVVLSKQFKYQRGNGSPQPASEGANHE